MVIFHCYVSSPEGIRAKCPILEICFTSPFQSICWIQLNNFRWLMFKKRTLRTVPIYPHFHFIYWVTAVFSPPKKIVGGHIGDLFRNPHPESPPFCPKSLEETSKVSIGRIPWFIGVLELTSLSWRQNEKRTEHFVGKMVDPPIASF